MLSHPPESVEAAESALGLFPSMALSSAQPKTDFTAGGREHGCGGFDKDDGTYYSPDRVTNRVSEFMRECGCDGLSLHKLRHFKPVSEIRTA
jgi:hypothetical protein